MNENNKRNKEKSEELNRAEEFIEDGKYDKALEIMRNFEKDSIQNPQDIVSCHLLECKLFFQQSLYEKVVSLSEKTHKESLGLGKNILTVDALNIKAHALIWIHQLEKAFEIINQGEELLKTLKQESPTEYKQREAYIAYIKGLGHREMDNFELALEHLEHSLTLREELGIKHEIADSFNHIAIVFYRKGELDNAIKYAEQAVAFAKESNKKLYIANCLRTFAGTNKMLRNLDQIIILNKQTLEIYRDINNKLGMAHILNNLGEEYRVFGDLDKALECLEQSLALYSELGNLRNLAGVYDYLIPVLIERNDLEKAQQCLSNLKQLYIQLEDDQTKNVYFLSKALILKTSPRTRNRGKAEVLFKKIIENKIINYDITIVAFLNLCELLLIELRLTNELEVLDELNQFIAQLLNIAENNKAFMIMCEVYLLKAKLSLVSFEVKKAQRFLTQAQQIAERFGFTQLKFKISTEYEDLEKKVKLWEKLKKSGASMADRFELARLDEHIGGLVKNRAVLTAQVIETEVAIHKEKIICLVCRGEVLKFSYICECGAIYCEKCARALTNLENVCWACDVPIDYSKPVKPFKEEEKRVKVEVKPKKNKISHTKS